MTAGPDARHEDHPGKLRGTTPGWGCRQGGQERSMLVVDAGSAQLQLTMGLPPSGVGEQRRLRVVGPGRGLRHNPARTRRRDHGRPTCPTVHRARRDRSGRCGVGHIELDAERTDEHLVDSDRLRSVPAPPTGSGILDPLEGILFGFGPRTVLHLAPECEAQQRPSALRLVLPSTCHAHTVHRLGQASHETTECRGIVSHRCEPVGTDGSRRRSVTLGGEPSPVAGQLGIPVVEAADDPTSREIRSTPRGGPDRRRHGAGPR